MTKTRACTVLLGVIAVGLALVIATGAVMLRGGISARAEPSQLEATVARQLRHWAIPKQARARQNPVPVDAKAIAEARAHFADHCAQCHANDGSGDSAMGRKLYPRAPDMRLSATQDLSDGEIFWIIENGIRFTGMPGWHAPQSETESWELVHFVRYLPRMRAEDRREMEALNPRSPEEWREREEEERFLRHEDRPANDTRQPDPGPANHQHQEDR